MFLKIIDSHNKFLKKKPEDSMQSCKHFGSSIFINLPI